MGKISDSRDASKPNESKKRTHRHSSNISSEGGEQGTAASHAGLSPEAARLMLHELQVNQIQLEMQNEELRRTQVALEASQALYFNFYNFAPVGFWAITPHGLIVEANTTIATMLGVARSSLIRQRMTRFIFPEDLDSYYLELKQLFESGAATNCELRLVKKDGAVFWVRIESTMVTDVEEGSLCRAVISDINDRKKAEADLRESEAKYRQLFALESDALFLIDNLSGKILDANLAAVGLYGYSFEELLEMRNVDLSAEPDETQKLTVHATDYAETAGVVKIPLRYHHKKDGTVFPVEINATSLMWKGHPAHIPSIRDITERNKKEETLRTSELRFRQLIKTLPVPVTVLNKAGEHTYINDRFVQVFGYAYDDIPTRERWRKLAFPDEAYRQSVAKIWSESIERAMESGRDSEPQEYRITCKDGTIRLVLISGILIGDEILATFTDITERRRLEQAMKTSYERHRNNELMNELILEAIPSQQTLFESSRILGMNTMQPFSTFLIVIDEYMGKPGVYWEDHFAEYQLLLNSMLDALEDDNRISWDSNNGIGVLWFEWISPEGIKDKQMVIAKQLQKIIAAKVPEVKISIGIGEFTDNLADIGARYRQASTAVSVGRKVWPQSKIYHYFDLGVFQVLSNFENEAQVTAFIERTLGKLLNYDKRKNEAFLDTLEIILMSDNLKEGAEKLSIHYQTLMFRKQRIEKILAVSFDDFSSRMAILTALQLLKLKKR